MNAVLNRAARRAAGTKPPSIKVRSHINVVPMEHVESYWQHEIASEGPWASDVPVIILQPEHDRGRVDRNWIEQTLERLWETRRRKGTLPLQIAIGDGHEVAIDIGLVDIVVCFQMPSNMRPTRKEHFDQMLIDNLRHFDSLCAGTFTDQMILASAFHRFHANGSPLLHYHNLIFGLRQEIRGDMDILGPLDMDLLLKALAKGRTLDIIGRPQH